MLRELLLPDRLSGREKQRQVRRFAEGGSKHERAQRGRQGVNRNRANRVPPERTVAMRPAMKVAIGKLTLLFSGPRNLAAKMPSLPFKAASTLKTPPLLEIPDR